MYFLQKTTKLKFLRVAKIVSDRKESREKLTFSVTFTFSVTYIYYFGNLTFWNWSSPLLKWFPFELTTPFLTKIFDPPCSCKMGAHYDAHYDCVINIGQCLLKKTFLQRFKWK